MIVLRRGLWYNHLINSVKTHRVQKGGISDEKICDGVGLGYHLEPLHPL